MQFEIRKSKEKEAAVYKTLYLKRALADQIDRIAREHDTSFNNVVVSMIESCLKEE